MKFRPDPTHAAKVANRRRAVQKKTPYGRIILTQRPGPIKFYSYLPGWRPPHSDAPVDREFQFHATKGWRFRRA